jgi:hypothetical protein
VNTSPFLAIKRLENQLINLIKRVDTDYLDQAEQKAVSSIRHIVIDARLDIRDYELSETREDQLRCATAAKKQVKKLELHILAAGNVFGAADVAQLGAELEQINEWLV